VRVLWSVVALVLSCGTERWDVKTLTDPAAARVDLSQPKHTTVAELQGLPAQKWSDAAPRSEAEKQAYTFDVWVQGYMKEMDEDFHIVVADAAKGGDTMVVEIPASDCLEKSAAGPKIDAARQAFLAAFQNAPPGKKYRPLRQPVKLTLTGVLFFDKLHGQKGVAPNAVELHPVVGVAKAAP
jgi:hypothetical protein